MCSLPRIDIHTHAFHIKIAEKATRQLENHYHIPLNGTGKWEDLKQQLAQANIDRCGILSAATTPHQVVPANDWAISLTSNPQAIPFGTMHPEYPNMEEELARLWDAGIRGIKLHPDFQGFRLDDPRLLPLFGAMEGKFTLLSHIGDTLPPAENPSCPYKFAAIKRKFPRLQMIASHFGGFYHWQYVPDALQGLDIYLDTSSTLFKIPQPLLEKIWHSFPSDHFLFGSDYPLFQPAEEIRLLQQRLRLTDSELEKILTNANQLNLTADNTPDSGQPVKD